MYASKRYTQKRYWGTTLSQAGSTLHIEIDAQKESKSGKTHTISTEHQRYPAKRKPTMTQRSEHTDTTQHPNAFPTADNQTTPLQEGTQQYPARTAPQEGRHDTTTRTERKPNNETHNQHKDRR